MARTAASLRTPGQPSPGPLDYVKVRTRTLRRPAVRVALGAVLALSLPLVAMQFTDEVVWGVADFLVVGVLLTAVGVTLELAVQKAGSLAVAAGIAGVGVAAAVFGKAGDAPGLVLLGLLLVFSACVLGVRAMQHSG